MSLSRAYLDRHIAAWEARLQGGGFSYRDKWPSRLFHHAPVENAVEILRRGELLSRAQSAGVRLLDIAGQDVINLRHDAHDFSRLYFRPRTPTQFHIEGIRRPAEYYHGERAAHAPVLIMLIFDAREVLLREGVCFSNGNMQSPWTEYGNTEEFFSAIEFAKVYHDSWHDGDRTITSARCAEVLAASPLPLQDTLQWVCCRSQAERQTLIHLLGDRAADYADKIIVSDDLRVFDKRFTYVEEVGIQSDGVTYRLSPRHDGANVELGVQVTVEGRPPTTIFGPAQWPPLPLNAKRWITRHGIPPGRHLVRIDLEGCRAFEAYLSLDEEPF